MPEKRKPGRPKKSERPVTPEVLEQIGSLYLRGKSARQIALVIALNESSVRHHLEHTIKPLWRNAIQWDAAIEVARADEVIRLAFEGYELSTDASRTERQKFSAAESLKKKVKGKLPKGDAGKEKLVERMLETVACKPDPAWLLIVVRMMDFKAKVKGGYAPKRINVQQHSELRVAGLTPSALDQAMLSRAAELIDERRRHRQIIDQAARLTGTDE